MEVRKQIRVIVADDHPILRRAVCRLLDQKNDILVIGESGDGRDTLALVNKLQPDVLLLDMEMPGMNGLDVTRQLHKEHNPVRILVLSGYDDRSYIRMVLQQGALGYLTKDEAPARIIDAVRKVAAGAWLGAPCLEASGGIAQ